MRGFFISLTMMMMIYQTINLTFLPINAHISLSFKFHTSQVKDFCLLIKKSLILFIFMHVFSLFASSTWIIFANVVIKRELRLHFTYFMAFIIMVMMYALQLHLQHQCKMRVIAASHFMQLCGFIVSNVIV